jgi:hypothetical protein
MSVKTFRKEISSANILSVETGTNTPCGGDAGHGGITIFKLKDEGATGWSLTFDGHVLLSLRGGYGKVLTVVG